MPRWRQKLLVISESVRPLANPCARKSGAASERSPWIGRSGPPSALIMLCTAWVSPSGSQPAPLGRIDAARIEAIAVVQRNELRQRIAHGAVERGRDAREPCAERLVRRAHGKPRLDGVELGIGAGEPTRAGGLRGLPGRAL